MKYFNVNFFAGFSFSKEVLDEYMESHPWLFDDINDIRKAAKIYAAAEFIRESQGLPPEELLTYLDVNFKEYEMYKIDKEEAINVK